MKLTEALKKANREDNYGAAGRISDMLRFKFGYNYQQTLDLVKLAGISPQRWEELMMMADTGY